MSGRISFSLPRHSCIVRPVAEPDPRRPATLLIGVSNGSEPPGAVTVSQAMQVEPESARAAVCVGPRARCRQAKRTCPFSQLRARAHSRGAAVFARPTESEVRFRKRPVSRRTMHMKPDRTDDAILMELQRAAGSATSSSQQRCISATRPNGAAWCGAVSLHSTAVPAREE